jgi:hypothetical protein
VAFTTSANGIELTDEDSRLPGVGACSGEADLSSGDDAADSGACCSGFSDA